MEGRGIHSVVQHWGLAFGSVERLLKRMLLEAHALVHT